MRERGEVEYIFNMIREKMKQRKKDYITVATVTNMPLCGVAPAEKIDAMSSDLGLELKLVMYV